MRVMTAIYIVERLARRITFDEGARRNKPISFEADPNHTFPAGGPSCEKDPDKSSTDGFSQMTRFDQLELV
jgi:hypothetical protein